jgi:hypothetical protein
VQPVIEVGKFYLILQKDDPKLWLGAVTGVVGGTRVAKKARLLPPTRGREEYWEHVGHSCILKGKGDWADVNFPSSCSGSCAAGGTANVRFYYPLNTDISCETWAKSLLESDDAETPRWLTGYWKKKRGERSVNEVLGNIGPEVFVVESLSNSQLRLVKKSQDVVKATALQLLGVGHPWYS